MLFMVPVICALFSADVNAGTASAARIAIIAITTSNSMRVNAEEGLFILIFMWVSFLRVVLRDLPAVALCEGGCVSEGLFWGLFVWFWFLGFLKDVFLRLFQGF